MRRSVAAFDYQFPYHAVIAAERCTEVNWEIAHQRCSQLGACPMHVVLDRTHHIVYRFKTPEAADTMAREFGGETYNSRVRGKGTGWEKWRRKQR